jgi:sugar/nucleoside kinase (ribokinase family)
MEKASKKSVCIDLREASLQLNKKIKAPTDEQIFELFQYELNTESLFVTLGSQGSVYCANNTIQRTKSFKSKIVDTIGAGDAFFAFSSLLSHTTLPENTKLIIPSLAASLTTTWLCNEQSVSKEKLLQYADQHLQTSI